MRFTGILICFSCFFIHLNSFSNEKVVNPVLSYKAQAVNNFAGGDKRSSQWLGLLTAGLKVDLHQTKLHKGGFFDIEGISTHGKGITSTVIHDIQGVSAIEAGNNPFILWKLFYEQRIQNLSFRIGLQNINDSFMDQNCVSDFTNSSYGVFPTASRNLSITNYPDNGFGLAFTYYFLQNFKVSGSLFDGRVTDLTKDHFNIRWPMNMGRDGILSIFEADYASDDKAFYQSSYALGGIFHNKRFQSVTDVAVSYQDNFVVYGYADHEFLHLGSRRATVFMQGSYALSDRNSSYGYLASGLVFNGFLLHSHKDHIGLGMTQLFFKNTQPTFVTKETETDYEMYVKFDIKKYLTIKPAFIYVQSSMIKNVPIGVLEFNFCIF